MMKPTSSPERRLWNIFLALHGLAYTFFWTAGIFQLFRMDGNLQVSALMLVLIWLPLFLVHVAAHAYYLRGSQSTTREREAYREGYSDAMQSKTKHVLEDVDHFSLGDDDELFEHPQQAGGILGTR